VPKARAAVAMVAVLAAWIAGGALSVSLAPRPATAAQGASAGARKADADDDDERKPARGAAADAATEAGTVSLDEAAQRRAGIATSTVPVRSLSTTSRAYAAVVDLQPLIELADAMAAARSQLAAARGRLEAARTAVDRDRALVAAGANSTVAQLEAAEANRQSEEAAVAAAAAHLDALRAAAGRGWGPPLAQSLADRGDLATRLLERRETLVQLTVPAGSLRPGERIDKPPRTAELLLEAGGGEPRRVPLRFVSWAARADPRMPGTSLIYAAAAREDLVPGATWLAAIPLGRPLRGGLIPPTAVVWSQGRAWFFVRSQPTTFTRHPLDAAASAVDGGYIAPEVDDDDAVVVQGAQALLSEAQRTQIQLDETGGR